MDLKIDGIGKFTHLETILYYDGELAYTCIDEKGQLHFVTQITDNREEKWTEWMSFPVTEKDMENMLTAKPNPDDNIRAFMDIAYAARPDVFHWFFPYSEDVAYGAERMTDEQLDELYKSFNLKEAQ